MQISFNKQVQEGLLIAAIKLYGGTQSYFCENISPFWEGGLISRFV